MKKKEKRKKLFAFTFTLVHSAVSRHENSGTLVKAFSQILRLLVKA